MNCARTDLCGGRSAMTVPTAIGCRAPGSQRWRADSSRESHRVRRDEAFDHDAVALDLSALPDEVRALIAMQAATIARLQAQLAKLRRMHFGLCSDPIGADVQRWAAPDFSGRGREEFSSEMSNWPRAGQVT